MRRSKSTTHKVQFVEKEPLAKSLAQKLGHTEEEVQVLKTKLSQASHQ